MREDVAFADGPEGVVAPLRGGESVLLARLVSSRAGEVARGDCRPFSEGVGDRMEGTLTIHVTGEQSTKYQITYERFTTSPSVRVNRRFFRLGSGGRISSALRSRSDMS